MLEVSFHTALNGPPRVTTVNVPADTDHTTIANIIAVYLTGDAGVAAVITIDSVVEL